MSTRLPSTATFPDLLVDPTRNPVLATTYWLRRDIVRGVFSANERLVVENIAAFYKIGLSPVREAILRVSANGLIVHEYLKGYRVALFSLVEFEDVFASYDLIHKTMLDRAFTHRNRPWEEAVILSLYRVLQAQNRPFQTDPQAYEIWIRMRRLFQRDLFASARSPMLTRILMNIAFQLERYIYQLFDRGHSPDRDAAREHRAIADAFIAHDYDAAKLHIERAFSPGSTARESVIAKLDKMTEQKSQKDTQTTLAPNTSESFRTLIEL